MGDLPSDDLSFEDLALPFLDAVWSFAMRLTGNHDEASDLVQETYLKAFRSFDRFTGPERIKSWLFTILKNLYIDTRRAQGTQGPRVSVDDVPPIPAVAVPSSSALTSADQVDWNQFEEEVERHLKALPESHLQALLLCDVEGLSYAEIAEVLGCPVGTVRSRIHRARGMLRERLEPYAKDAGYMR